MTDAQDAERFAEIVDENFEGEGYDETISEPSGQTGDPEDDVQYAREVAFVPEGSEERDEEWADDDPADVPAASGGTESGVDTDDDGVADTELPEGTDSIVDVSDDWE